LDFSDIDVAHVGAYLKNWKTTIYRKYRKNRYFRVKKLEYLGVKLEYLVEYLEYFFYMILGIRVVVRTLHYASGVSLFLGGENSYFLI